MWSSLYRDIMVSYIDVLSDTSRDLYMWSTLYRDIMVSYIDVLSDTSRDLYVELFI